MKNKSYFILFGIIIILIFLVVDYVKTKDLYNKTISNYCNINDGVFNQYAIPYEYYFDNYFMYPKNESELKEFFSNDKDYLNFLEYLLEDPFSKVDSSILYVPLYSKESKMREGFAIISAGIDGKINTIINDTMFLHGINKLSFYNKIGDPVFPPYYNPDSAFNLLNYLFGKKDFLVYYIDGVTNYINNNRKYTPTTFYQRFIKFRQVDKQRITLTLFGEVDSVFNDYVTIKENDITVYCNMYHGRKFSVKSGDSVKVACCFNGEANKEKKNIRFSNCIILDSND